MSAVKCTSLVFLVQIGLPLISSANLLHAYTKKKKKPRHAVFKYLICILAWLLLKRKLVQILFFTKRKCSQKRVNWLYHRETAKG